MKKILYQLATDQRNGAGASILKFFLWILSIVYGCLVNAREWLYKISFLKAYKIPKPVVSVGNLTLGGVGKTPFVQWLSLSIQGKNHKPVILTRGFMNQPYEQSDEVQMLREKLSGVDILVGANRVDNAKKYLEKNTADIFILDDGFQHWRLKRDCDIVLVDAVNPFGNAQLIPRGILREPLSSLRRASVVVLTKTDQGQLNLKSLREQVAMLCPKALIAEAIHLPVGLSELRSGKVFGLSSIHQKKMASLCSIGDPRSFQNTLSNLGADLKENVSFEDHYVYRLEDVRKISENCLKNNLDIIVTTSKDAVKLKTLLPSFDASISILVLDIKMSIVKGKEELLERIYRLL